LQVDIGQLTDFQHGPPGSVLTAYRHSACPHASSNCRPGRDHAGW